MKFTELLMLYIGIQCCVHCSSGTYTGSVVVAR